MTNLVELPDDQGQFELRVEKMLADFGIPDDELTIGIMCQGKQVRLGDLLFGIIHAAMTVGKEEAYAEALRGEKGPKVESKVIAIGVPGEPGLTPTRRN